MVDEVRIQWPGGEVRGRLAGTGEIGMLLAHGAGTDQNHRFMVGLRDGLASSGMRVLTFNYPYTERGGRRPDATGRLLECHRAAADFLAREVGTLFLGGRSMGGRMATYLVADGYSAAGLVLYAYPLHPAGRPESLRIDHFPRVGCPLLFFQGTRDALSRMDLFEAHISTLPGATVEILEGATHSFTGGGWTETSVMERLVTVTDGWISALSSGRTTVPRA